MSQTTPAVVLGVVAGLLLGGMAQAQGQPAQGGQGRPMMGCHGRFDALDTNHDGKMSQEEFAAVPHYRGNAEQLFKSMDSNTDGALTKEEFCEGKGPGRVTGKGMGKGATQ